MVNYLYKLYLNNRFDCQKFYKIIKYDIKQIEKTGLSGTDRLLGGVFGGVRGLALVIALIVVAGLTPVPQDPWFQQSRTIQSLMPLAEWSAQYLPDYILEHMDLTPETKADEEVAATNTCADAWMQCTTAC